MNHSLPIAVFCLNRSLDFHGRLLEPFPFHSPLLEYIFIVLSIVPCSSLSLPFLCLLHESSSPFSPIFLCLSSVFCFNLAVPFQYLRLQYFPFFSLSVLADHLSSSCLIPGAFSELYLSLMSTIILETSYKLLFSFVKITSLLCSFCLLHFTSMHLLIFGTFASFVQVS